jgi:hypothetical protein
MAEGVVVGNDGEALASFKVASELAKSMYYGEKLELVDGVVGFMLVELAGFVRNWLQSLALVLK